MRLDISSQNCSYIHQLGGTIVVQLLKTLIMKSGGSVMVSEADMLSLIAFRTTSWAPRVYRSYRVKDDIESDP